MVANCVISYAKYSRSPTIVLSEVYFQGLCHEDVFVT